MLLSKNHFYVNQINPIKQAKLFLTFGLCASFCISTVASDSVDTTRILVDKLTLNSYKSTLKGLTRTDPVWRSTTRYGAQSGRTKLDRAAISGNGL